MIERIHTGILTTSLNIQEAYDFVADPAHGAVDVFVGAVRNHHEGNEVHGMTYDVHEALAVTTFQEIAEEVQTRWAETKVYISHYKGELDIGGISVIIAVSSAHRAESFDACRYIIEEMKKRSPVWKKEHYPQGKSEWLKGHSLRANENEANIAGVVLAGGKSSRMGQSKAMLEYKGAPLLDHMIGVLNKASLKEIYVSGEFEGYNCIADTAPHEGPARAIIDVMAALKDYDGVLFIPVDMPFLTPKVLDVLLTEKEGACFKKYPLPAFIKQGEIKSNSSAVRDLLNDLNVPSVALPLDFEDEMRNINTQKQWQEILGA